MFKCYPSQKSDCTAVEAGSITARCLKPFVYCRPQISPAGTVVYGWAPLGAGAGGKTVSAYRACEVKRRNNHYSCQVQQLLIVQDSPRPLPSRRLYIPLLWQSYSPTTTAAASHEACKRGHRTHLADFKHAADVSFRVLYPEPGSPGIRYALSHASHFASYAIPGTSGITFTYPYAY